MLKTTSEELACPREDLSVARKDELRKLLLEQVPTVLGLLTGERGSERWCWAVGPQIWDQTLRHLSAGILETYWDKHSIIASTPPPSPTSGESGESFDTCSMNPNPRLMDAEGVTSVFCVCSACQWSCWALCFRAASTQSCSASRWQPWTAKVSNSAASSWNVWLTCSAGSLSPQTSPPPCWHPSSTLHDSAAT